VGHTYLTTALPLYISLPPSLFAPLQTPRLPAPANRNYPHRKRHPSSQSVRCIFYLRIKYIIVYFFSDVLKSLQLRIRRLLLRISLHRLISMAHQRKWGRRSRRELHIRGLPGFHRQKRNTGTPASLAVASARGLTPLNGRLLK
jgi:hypothetical protein